MSKQQKVPDTVSESLLKLDREINILIREAQDLEYSPINLDETDESIPKIWLRVEELKRYRREISGQEDITDKRINKN